MIKTKRRKLRLSFLLVLVFSFCFIGCNNSDNTTPNKVYENGNLYVNYLSVGTSDCVIIRFANQQVLIIDTAINSKDNQTKIKETLEELNANIVDYLVLTHPDIEHYGNANWLIENYKVNKLFAPEVNEEIFTDFAFLLNQAKDKDCEVSNFKFGKTITIDNANLYFLYAKQNEKNSSINEQDDIEIISDYEADLYSPIILLEYNNLKFLFGGDKTLVAEEYFLDCCKIDMYKRLFKKDLSMVDIDFYMMSSNGSAKSNGSSFLEYIKPKNVIISVDGDSAYGVPSELVAEKLTNMNSRILRTDHEGKVVVSVDKNGGTSIKTEYDLNAE